MAPIVTTLTVFNSVSCLLCYFYCFNAHGHFVCVNNNISLGVCVDSSEFRKNASSSVKCNVLKSINVNNLNSLKLGVRTTW